MAANIFLHTDTALAQAPAARPGPPSTITTPPRDFSRGGAPTTYFWDPDVIAVEVPDQPGALATIMALFRDEGVNIEYLYASLEHSANQAVIVLKVDDVAGGLAMLQKHGVSTTPSF